MEKTGSNASILGFITVNGDFTNNFGYSAELIWHLLRRHLWTNLRLLSLALQRILYAAARVWRISILKRLFTKSGLKLSYSTPCLLPVSLAENSSVQRDLWRLASPGPYIYGRKQNLMQTQILSQRKLIQIYQNSWWTQSTPRGEDQ